VQQQLCVLLWQQQLQLAQTPQQLQLHQPVDAAAWSIACRAQEPLHRQPALMRMSWKTLWTS